MSKIIEVLTESEAADFATYTEVIKKGAKTFIEVGKALVKVHEGKLWRADFKSFEEYAETYGVKRRQAFNLMQAVQLTLTLESVQCTALNATPENIEHLKGSSANAVLELAKVSPKKQAKVLAAAVEATGGKLTAPAIAQAAAKEDHRATPEPAISTRPYQQTVDERAARDPEFAEAIKANEPLPVVPTKGHITPAQFQEVLDQLTARILPGEHKKFGQIANRWTDKLMNWGAEQKTVWAYGG